MSSFVHYFKAICDFKLELQSGNAQFGSKLAIFCPVWPWNLTDDLEKNRAPLPCYFKLCASFHSHWWVRTRVTVRKRPNQGKNCFDLRDVELWPLTMNFCMDITFVNGNNSWNFMMIRWQEHCEKGVTDGRTDRRTDRQMERSVLRAAWSQLKMIIKRMHYILDTHLQNMWTPIIYELLSFCVP